MTCNVTSKEGNTTGTFYLWHLLHILNMINKFGGLCTSVHLYTIILCADDMAVYMSICDTDYCMCAILLVTHISSVVCIYIGILNNHR